MIPYLARFVKLNLKLAGKRAQSTRKPAYYSEGKGFGI